MSAISALAATPRRTSSRRLGSLLGTVGLGIEAEDDPAGVVVALTESALPGRALRERLVYGLAQDAPVSATLRLR